MKRLSYIGCMLLLMFVNCMPLHANEVEDLHAKQIYIMDPDSGAVVFEQEGDQRISPASMTKVMTAIVVIENTRHFDQMIMVSDSDIEALEAQGSSRIGLKAGEQLSIEDALYGLLMGSGGDCANVLARSTTGTKATFVELMNRKAEALGMTNTHFTSPIGLYDEAHYSTVEDMAKLMQYALGNERFLTYANCRENTIHTDQRDILIGNYIYHFFEKYKLPYDDMLAVKSGYETTVGHCLASAAEQNGHRLIIVLAGAGMEKEDFSQRDTRKLYDYYFANINTISIDQEVKNTIKTKGIAPATIDTDLPDEIQIPYETTTKNVTYEYQANGVGFKVSSGQRIGTVLVKQNEQVIANIPLRAVSAATALDIYILLIVGACCIIAFFLVQHRRHTEILQKGGNAE